MERQCVFMSIRPVYAYEILDGLKDCEVRTYSGRIGRGDLVILYASSPVKAAVGSFYVSFVSVAHWADLQRRLANLCPKLVGLRDNVEYIVERYSESKRRLIVLGVSEPVKFVRQVDLNTIRRLGLKNPPLSYVRLDFRICRGILEESNK